MRELNLELPRNAGLVAFLVNLRWGVLIPSYVGGCRRNSLLDTYIGQVTIGGVSELVRYCFQDYKLKGMIKMKNKEHFTHKHNVKKTTCKARTQ